MTVPPRLPHEIVAEPLSQAMTAIVVRGTAGFLLVVGLVVTCPWLCATWPSISPTAHALLPGAFVLYVVARALHGRRRPDQRQDAWGRATAADAREAVIATIVAAALPAGALLACLAELGPQVVDPAQRAMAVGVYAPALLALWFCAVTSWVSECEARLSRAATESDRRFRDYWSSVATLRS